jgi:hypothetical protein
MISYIETSALPGITFLAAPLDNLRLVFYYLHSCSMSGINHFFGNS